ncbi:MAG: flagellar biosynthesis anti-sigma factor FlgM [Methylococcales bacterium]|nr:flagellar biosynthesis anti-sigma factor FlgM [Methylococcales bacterium]
MAIEIKNGAVPLPFQTTSTNSITSKSNTEFALTLSNVKPTESISSVERTDSVVITNSATQIRKNFESSAVESKVDAERLMRIKAAIENGTYEINPDKIAAKMMQFEFSSYKS